MKKKSKKVVDNTTGDIEKDLGIKSTYTSEEVERKYSHPSMRANRINRFTGVKCRHGFPNLGERCKRCMVTPVISFCGKCKEDTLHIMKRCQKCKDD